MSQNAGGDIPLSIFILYVYTHVYIWVSMYVYTVHVDMHMCMYVCMYVRTYVRMYVCIHIHIVYIICACHLPLSQSVYFSREPGVTEGSADLAEFLNLC